MEIMISLKNRAPSTCVDKEMLSLARQSLLQHLHDMGLLCLLYEIKGTSSRKNDPCCIRCFFILVFIAHFKYSYTLSFNCWFMHMFSFVFCWETSSTWVESSEEAESRNRNIVVNRNMVGRISVTLIYEYSSTDSTCVSPLVRACIKIAHWAQCMYRVFIIQNTFCCLLSLSLPLSPCIYSLCLPNCRVSERRLCTQCLSHMLPHMNTFSWY